MSVAQMIPSNSPAAAIQRVVERIDRQQTRKALDKAIADRDRTLAELDAAVKAAEAALEACEQRRLERALVVARRNRADCASVHNGQVSSQQRLLRDDFNNDADANKAISRTHEAINRAAQELSDSKRMTPEQVQARREQLNTATKKLTDLSDPGNVIFAADVRKACREVLELANVEGD